MTGELTCCHTCGRRDTLHHPTKTTHKNKHGGWMRLNLIRGRVFFFKVLSELPDYKFHHWMFLSEHAPRGVIICFFVFWHWLILLVLLCIQFFFGESYWVWQSHHPEHRAKQSQYFKTWSASPLHVLDSPGTRATRPAGARNLHLLIHLKSCLLRGRRSSTASQVTSSSSNLRRPETNR